MCVCNHSTSLRRRRTCQIHDDCLSVELATLREENAISLGVKQRKLEGEVTCYSDKRSCMISLAKVDCLDLQGVASNLASVWLYVV